MKINKEKIKNYLLYKDNLEFAMTVGWIITILGWIIAFNYIGVWSIIIPIGFYILQSRCIKILKK